MFIEKIGELSFINITPNENCKYSTLLYAIREKLSPSLEHFSCTKNTASSKIRAKRAQWHVAFRNTNPKSISLAKHKPIRSARVSPSSTSSQHLTRLISDRRSRPPFISLDHCIRIQDQSTGAHHHQSVDMFAASRTKGPPAACLHKQPNSYIPRWYKGNCQKWCTSNA